MTNNYDTSYSTITNDRCCLDIWNQGSSECITPFGTIWKYSPASASLQARFDWVINFVNNCKGVSRASILCITIGIEARIDTSAKSIACASASVFVHRKKSRVEARDEAPGSRKNVSSLASCHSRRSILPPHNINRRYIYTWYRAERTSGLCKLSSLLTQTKRTISNLFKMSTSSAVLGFPRIGTST